MAAASAALQLLAALLALRLWLVTKRHASWLLIAAGFALLSVRHGLPFPWLVIRDARWPLDPVGESIALLASALLLGGVALIVPLLGNLNRALTEKAQSQRQLQAFLDHSATGIYAKDLEGRYILVNNKTSYVFGRPPAEVLGKKDEALLAKEVAAAVRVNDEQIAKTRHHMVFDETVPHHDGTLHQYISVKFPLIDDAGTLFAIAGISTDITDRLRVEAERHLFESRLQQAQKLESLGVLAGGVAHDFNNLLVGMLGSADLALTRPGIAPDVREHLTDIRSAAESAAGLCRELLAYSGRSATKKTAVDTTKLVQSLTRLLEVSISKKVSLRCELDESLPLVEADATQLQQVVMNLLTNASEAMGDRRGTISIATRRLTVGPEGLADQQVGERLAPGDYVCIEVRDTGLGMDDETRNRLFEPFFSTKATGRGLGLAAVAGIVRTHHGGICVKSSPGRGATFRVLLPVPAHTLAPARAQTPRVAPSAPQSATILVVDDEPLVRKVAERMLTRSGFAVIGTDSGRHAAEILSHERGHISLVLLDMHMPDLDGEQTLRILRRLDPAVKVLLSSGYDMSLASRPPYPEAVSGFVQKPYTTAELDRAVRSALA